MCAHATNMTNSVINQNNEVWPSQAWEKGKLTKDNIPTIFKPVFVAMQSIFPHRQDCDEQTSSDQRSIGKEKQKNESTGSPQTASVSANLISIAPNQIKCMQSYSQY